MPTADSYEKVAKAKRMAAQARASWEGWYGKKGELTADLKKLGYKAPAKPAARPGLNYKSK